MDKANNSQNPVRREQKVTLLPVAGGDAPVGVQIVVSPVPVQTPALAILIEVGEVPVTVCVHHECAKSRLCHHPLNTLRIESNLESIIHKLSAPSSNR